MQVGFQDPKIMNLRVIDDRKPATAMKWSRSVCPFLVMKQEICQFFITLNNSYPDAHTSQ